MRSANRRLYAEAGWRASQHDAEQREKRCGLASRGGFFFVSVFFEASTPPEGEAKFQSRGRSAGDVCGGNGLVRGLFEASTPPKGEQSPKEGGGALALLVVKAAIETKAFQRVNQHEVKDRGVANLPVRF